MKLSSSKIIILIIALAALLRAYKLNVSPSINPDEAAIGYNAFSLIQTGKDEHGQPWPIHFTSFGDNKPGGYFYLSLPFVYLLGPTVLAVRLPNLILSLLAIYFFYRLINLLTSNLKLATLSTLILAINPWHLHFSRGGWESNAALSFIIIGVYFFYLFTKYKKQSHFFLFTLMFICSLYTYHSARITAPLLAGFLFMSNYRFLVVNYRRIIVPVVVGLIITIPLISSFIQHGGAARFNSVGITADQGPFWRSNELINQHSAPTLAVRFIHNRRLLYLISWAEKYLSHFNPNFLFLTGDEVPRSKVPDMGQLYLIELPLLLFGLYHLLRSTNRQFQRLIIALLIISPLASSLTFQTPSALRALLLSIPLTAIVAYGLSTITFKPLITSLIIFYIFSLIYYLDAYHVHYPQRLPTAWSYGFEEVAKIIVDQKDKYNQVYLTNRYDQPYVLYLFYTHYPPSKIQPQIKLTPPDQFGFSTVQQIDNITFFTPDLDKILPQSLVIADGQTDYGFQPIRVINFPNGTPAFKIYIK